MHSSSTVNYASAVKELFKTPKKKVTGPHHYLKSLPKGWIWLSKKDNCYFENRTNEEIKEDEEYLEQQRIADLSWKYVQKYIQVTQFCMERDGYNYEEMDQYLYSVLYAQEEEDETDNYESEQSNYSSDYSSDDAFSDFETM